MTHSTKVRVGFIRVTLLIVGTQGFVWHAHYVKGPRSPLVLWDGGSSEHSPTNGRLRESHRDSKAETLVKEKISGVNVSR